MRVLIYREIRMNHLNNKVSVCLILELPHSGQVSPSLKRMTSSLASVSRVSRWVWATLDELAIDDEQHARLRDTLQVFLSTGSYTATAERMMLHKNSVLYRIRKAEEALAAAV